MEKCKPLQCRLRFPVRVHLGKQGSQVAPNLDSYQSVPILGLAANMNHASAIRLFSSTNTGLENICLFNGMTLGLKF